MNQRVIFLDDDDDLRDVVPEFLGGLGVACSTAASLAELRAAMTGAGSYDLAILDINLGADQPNGVDAYRWLRRSGFAGRIVFLTGHARSHPMVQEALHLGDASVHDKPITASQLRALVESPPAT